MGRDGGLLAMSDARGRSRSLLPERVAENLNRVFILRGIVENLRKIGWLEKNQKWFFPAAKGMEGYVSEISIRILLKI
jgi:hypothetical protein